MRKKLKEREGNPWIVHFVDNDDRNLELRKIPRLVENDNIQVFWWYIFFPSHVEENIE